MAEILAIMATPWRLRPKRQALPYAETWATDCDFDSALVIENAWLLPRLVGRNRALELCATSRAVDSADALTIGMIDRVVPAADLVAEMEKLARAFAAALALGGIKRALEASERNDLRSQLKLEAERQMACFQSDEARAWIAAFVTK